MKKINRTTNWYMVAGRVINVWKNDKKYENCFFNYYYEIPVEVQDKDLFLKLIDLISKEENYYESNGIHISNIINLSKIN